MFRGKNKYKTTWPSCSLIVIMNYFSALHEYDLEIRLHRRGLHQTSAFCGHVFTVKLLLKNKNTWTLDRKLLWLPDANLCYPTLIAECPCVAVLLHGATTSSAMSPQMHHQNPVDAPLESRGTTRIRHTPTESCLHLQRDDSNFTRDAHKPVRRVHFLKYYISQGSMS